MLEFLEPGIAAERLVESKESKDHIGFGFRQPLVGRPKVFRAMAGDHLIAGHGKIAKHQVVLGKLCDDECLEPAVVLHPVGERVANDCDVIAGF